LFRPSYFLQINVFLPAPKIICNAERLSIHNTEDYKIRDSAGFGSHRVSENIGKAANVTEGDLEIRRKIFWGPMFSEQAVAAVTAMKPGTGFLMLNL
jgi:hypothetical protein